MKRRMLSLLLIAVMVLGMLPTVAMAAPAESSGVYQIGTAEELLWFAQEVNGGNTGIKGQLTADIDLSGIDWPGIGSTDNRFAGSFDGQGHTVTFNNADWGLSGWMFSVNDVYPGLGCSAYTLADGDVIVFSYTCDLGADLGAEKVYE